MVNLLKTEILKLKRSTMIIISILGAIVAPLIVVFATYVHEPSTEFKNLFYNTNLYTVAIIGVPLYGVIAAYLFNREYVEGTLKNLLTIPISRISFITSKLIILFIWIMMLTFVAWFLTLLLGIIGQFRGMDDSLLIDSLKNFFVGGGLLFILSTPIVCITIISKNYVPPIIFSIVITLINVMATNSEHRGLFPWTAALDIANNSLLPAHPAGFSYIVIISTSLMGLILTLLYFNRMDIN